MIVEFYDRQDHSSSMNGTVVGDNTQLMEIIDCLQSRPPFFCELIGENGYQLLVGIGKSIGCAQFSRQDGVPPYLMATISQSKGRNEGMEFLTCNTPTPVLARYCLPMNVVKEIAAYFQRTGETSPAVEWEVI